MRQIIITENDSGQRLDKFLTKKFKNMPTSLMYKYIRTKYIKLNGKRCEIASRLQTGDVLTLYIKDEFFEETPDTYDFLKAPVKLDIIYEDENILLLNKKPGLLVHPDDTYHFDSLIARILHYLYDKGEYNPEEENSFTPALVNRIDRNTGGIVIAAKNAEALRIINEKIKLREIEKYYLCAVHGRPNPSSGTLENYLFKDAVKNRVYVKSKSEPGAKTAVTEYHTLRSKGPLSLVECRLLTGRTHQIRAQMAYAGWPLLGDGKYGSERFNKNYTETGQALYSYKLLFSFPTDAGILNYLRGREFTVDSVDFVEKYFSL